MTTPSPAQIRILYVTAGFPFPLSSGYLRHFHLLQHLAPEHHLHLLSLVGPRFRPEHVQGVDGFVDQVSTFARPEQRQRANRLGRLLDPGRPDASTSGLARAVDEEIRRGHVDVVVLTGKETSVVADVVAGRVPLVVDLCDATSSRVTQELRLSNPARRAGLMIRRRNMRRVERHLIDVGDALITASDRDREALVEEGAPVRARHALVVPNGIDLDYWHRGPEQLGESVVFCGNLGYRPNADAATHLTHDVMPHVWKHRPHAPVVIIGTDASPALQRQLQAPRVTLTGSVPDVRPHLEGGAVFAAPLRVAAGIQNKLLEAMAMELPVVTSTVAAAGLIAEGGRPPLTVTDAPEATAAAIVELLDAIEAGQRAPRAEARSWVAERFSWDRSGRALADLVRSANDQELTAC